MLSESILIVGSQRAAARPNYATLCWLAARLFREARSYVPEQSFEKGWPASANWMFARALEHVERHFHEDIFFLEPDGIPTRHSWWDEICGAWEDARSNAKPFMGALVPHTIPHMTGIGCYAANWRQFAPSLVNCPENEAWDTHAAYQVLPHLYETKLIQHIFKRHQPAWTVPHLAILDKRACIFHQDKAGLLIEMLDQAQFGGACLDHPFFGYRHWRGAQTTMRKFYYASSASLPKQVGMMAFNFEHLEPFGGALPGVYTTELELEQDALSDLTANPASGVTEISLEDYEKVTKKKLGPETPPDTSKPSAPQPPTSPPVLPTPSKSPAVLVADPLGHGSKVEAPVKTAVIEDIHKVIKTAKVEPVHVPQSARPRKPAGRK